MDHQPTIRCRLVEPWPNGRSAELALVSSPEEMMAAAEVALTAMRDARGFELPFITLEVYSPDAGGWVQPIYRGLNRQVRVRGGLSYLGSWRDRFAWCVAAVGNEARLRQMPYAGNDCGALPLAELVARSPRVG